MAKKPRVNLSKHQIKEQIDLQSKVKRQKPIAEKLFAIFQKHCTSVKHATQTCEVFAVVTDALKKKAWKDKHVSDLNFLQEIMDDKEMVDRDLYTEMVTLFDEVTIEDAQEIIEGMERAINMNMMKKVKEVPMSEVKLEEVF